MLESICIQGLLLTFDQVAYLMADISDVNVTVIKDLYQSLESLSCMTGRTERLFLFDQLTRSSSNHDTSLILSVVRPILKLNFQHDIIHEQEASKAKLHDRQRRFNSAEMFLKQISGASLRVKKVEKN